MMDKEIQNDFYTHSYNAKRIANNIHRKNKTGRGSVKTPVDFMDKEAKKEYTEAKMVNQIDLSKPMTLKQFRKLRQENRKLQLEVWGNVYGHNSCAIARVLNCSQSRAYSYLKESGLTETFKAKHAEDKELGKKRTQELNLARISPDTLADALAIKPEETVEINAEVEISPPAGLAAPDSCNLIAEPQNAVQTAQISANATAPALNIIIDGKMPGYMVKAAVQGLEDGESYSILIMRC